MAARPSSRQSIYGRPTNNAGGLGRQSMLPGANSANSAPITRYDDDGNVVLTAAQQRVKDKYLEHAAFVKLLRQAQQQLQFLEDLSRNTDLLNNGSDVFAKVLSNWQNVFRATHLALATLSAQQARGVEPEAATPSTLVRIPTAARQTQDAQDGEKGA